MKKILKIAILFLAVAMLPACSAQRRAERKVRRAVELCPELVQMKAHPIDTVLTVPAFTDRAEVPVMAVLLCDSVVTRTDHGKMTLKVDREDGMLTVEFTADTQEVPYKDTLFYSQVTVEKKETRTGWTSKDRISLWTCCFLLGVAIALRFLREKD